MIIDTHAHTVPGTMLESFLLDHPPVMLRMLKAEARRVRGANSRSDRAQDRC